MRKLFITMSAILMTTTMLTGCKSKEETIGGISNIEGATTVDMSGYSALQSNDGFMSITATQLVNAIGDGKTNAIIYLGFEGCSNCQNAIADIQTAAIEMNETVYYLDCSKELETDAMYDTVFNALESILVSYNDDDPTDVDIYTPHVFRLENGQLVQGYVGYTEGHDYKADMTFTNQD